MVYVYTFYRHHFFQQCHGGRGPVYLGNGGGGVEIGVVGLGKEHGCI